jgi:ATP-dependent helicase/nuclease subunit B
MLRIVTGPFHPDLESALVDDVTQLKVADPLAPLAILVPSEHLADRLRCLLVVDSGLSLLQVHLLTFHQLALRLCAEAYGVAADGGARLPLALANDLFFEHLLRKIGETPLPALQTLRLTGRAPGTWAALWASLRDLKDAQVSADRAEDALAEGMFDEEDAEPLRALFALYGGLLKFMRSLMVGTAEDLAEAAIPLAAASHFLSRMRRVLYYGFYELTQVQLSLFEAVVGATEATVYFPLRETPAYAFARRFHERFLMPLAAGGAAAGKPEPEAGRAGEQPRARLVNAVGPEGEFHFVGREILDLVETNGYAFSEIGVVARTLEPYRDVLQPVFDRYRIPFTSTAARPVLQEPATKVVLQLAGLSLNGFYRPAVLDVVASAFYRLPKETPSDGEPRPDLWRLAAGLLGITRGEEEWRRLERVGEVGLPGEPAGEAEAEGRFHPAIDPGQCRLLWRAVSRLITDCRTLPERGSPVALTEAFLGLASTHLNIPGLTMAGGATEEPAPAPTQVGEAIRSAVEQVARLDEIGLEMTWSDWVQTFSRSLERATRPIEGEDHAGVRVLDAMAARGVPFRALFLVGLNEKVFPRVIREDAFLRDRARRVLDTTLGYKLNEKLAGYDEEVLLFALLRESARERLYWLYQRADADGRSLAPSPFVAEGLRSCETVPEEGRAETSIPRRLVERIERIPFAPTLVSRQDLALWVALKGHDPSTLLAAVGQEPALFRHGVEALARIEADGDELGPHDGLTRSMSAHWDRLAARGVAPTPLERYARCPFQYFAADVLGLRPVRIPLSGELEAHNLGSLCHAVLTRGVELLMVEGWPDETSGAGATQIGRCVTAAVDEVFGAHAARQGTGLPLLWDLTKETVTDLVTALLSSEEADFRATGFRPHALEADVQGALEGLTLPGVVRLPLRGRADRVDRRAEPPACRIVDYKYKPGGEKKPEDKNLVTAAVRGFRLQPPLYARMTVPGNALPLRVDFRFLAPQWDPSIDRASFESAVWNGPIGRQIAGTLSTLLDGIRAGRYFILPDTYCDYCDFDTACRRLHGPTGTRARRAAAPRALRLLRKQKAADA